MRELMTLMNRIGIYTLGDIQRFKKEEQGVETLEQALIRYLKELGTDFCIKE